MGQASWRLDVSKAWRHVVSQAEVRDKCAREGAGAVEALRLSVPPRRNTKGGQCGRSVSKQG